MFRFILKRSILSKLIRIKIKMTRSAFKTYCLIRAELLFYTKII